MIKIRRRVFKNRFFIFPYRLLRTTMPLPLKRNSRHTHTCTKLKLRSKSPILEKREIQFMTKDGENRSRTRCGFCLGREREVNGFEKLSDNARTVKYSRWLKSHHCDSVVQARTERRRIRVEEFIGGHGITTKPKPRICRNVVSGSSSMNKGYIREFRGISGRIALNQLAVCSSVEMGILKMIILWISEKPCLRREF